MDHVQAKQWPKALSMSTRPPSRWMTGAKAWFVVLSTVWFCLLALLHAFPQIDVAIADLFFQQAPCLTGDLPGRICGDFSPSSQQALQIMRRVLFYLPVFFAVVLLCVLIANLQQYGATYCAKRTRQCLTALAALVMGPYLLVNLILKSVSGRPRPYETDLFGGDKLFTAAGSFDGSCYNNCSFISGEAAGAGWIACLIILVPAKWRPVVAPPLFALTLASPALRVAFGGHYFSDAVLGFLSSAVVYAGLAVYFEMTQAEKKRAA